MYFTDNNNSLPVLDEDENQLKIGWRKEATEILLTVPPDREVEIRFGKANMSIDIHEEPWFNGRTFAVTIAGHETSDLFKWSKRFEPDSPVRFTWLIIPRVADSSRQLYPIIGVVVIVTSIGGFIWTIKNDRIMQGRTNGELGQHLETNQESE